MGEWTDILRVPDYFNLIVLNRHQVIERELEIPMTTITGFITIHHEVVHPVTIVPDDFPGIAPDFIGVSEINYLAREDSTEDHITPHASEPAPAIRAGCVSFVWGIEAHSVTSSVAQRGHEIRPHRTDTSPAVITATGLSIHYNNGSLHRKGRNPAIKAEHLGALWYGKDDVPGELYRGNGPSIVAFDGYHEFWTEGEFKGHNWKNSTLRWSASAPDDFLNGLRGGTDMFSNDVYFQDAQDEVAYIANFS